MSWSRIIESVSKKQKLDFKQILLKEMKIRPFCRVRKHLYKKYCGEK